MSFEDQVRDELGRQASQIQPNERLAQILAAGSQQPAPVTSLRSIRRPGLWLSAAAAVVLAVALAAMWALRPQTAATNTEMAAAPATTGASAPAVTEASSSTNGDAQAKSATRWAMPVYYVTTGTSLQPWLLNRDFISVDAPSDISGRVQLAVSTLVTGTINGTRLPYSDWQQPWPEGEQVTTVVDSGQIRVDLNQGLRSGLTPQQQRMAYQAIAWTATAAAQMSVPVQIWVAGTVAMTASRPASGSEWNDLAPIWIVAPSRWSTQPAGQPILVRGEACVDEGSFSWQVLRSGQVVQSGRGSASSGCPVRGQFSFTIPALPQGEYVLQVQPSDASVSADRYQATLPLTVV